MFTAARWRLLVSTLPWVLLLIAVTALRDDVLGISGLVDFSDIGAILTGAALIIGLMLAGVIADFKESERLPAELAATLETMGDAIQSAHAGGKAGDLGDLLHDYDAVSARVENWFLNENTSEDCYQAIEEITFLTARLEQSGAAPGYLARLLAEQHNLRRTVARIDTIRTTTFIQPGYALLDLFVGTVLVLLVMANFRSQTAAVPRRRPARAHLPLPGPARARPRQPLRLPGRPSRGAAPRSARPRPRPSAAARRLPGRPRSPPRSATSSPRPPSPAELLHLLEGYTRIHLA